MALSDAEVAEINTSFKERMAHSKKVWASRGPDARAAAAAKRAVEGGTWRQMSGLRLMAHEVSHVGNKPFMIGFAICAVGTLYAQTKFTDDMKKGSVYWQQYHATK